MGRDTIQLENAVSTISQEYVLEFTSEYGMPEILHPELPGPEDLIVEFHEGTVGHYQIHLSQLVFHTVADWRTSAPKDQMPPVGSYSMADINSLNMRRTAIQKQPEALLCLVGLSQRYFLGDDVYPTFLYNDNRDMDLFSLISAPNPAKVKIETRPHATRESKCTTQGAEEGSCRLPPLIEYPQGEITGFHRNRGGYHCLRTCDQKIPVHTKGMSDPDSLAYVKLWPAPKQDVSQCSRKAVVTEDSNYEKSTSFTSMFGSLGNHIAPPGYFLKLRHLPNDEFLNQYNTPLTRQVAMGSQLRLRFEQETKLLKKAVAQAAQRDQRIEAREKHI
nr:hypothetical protein [Tanacetum cinerariifolium]